MLTSCCLILSFSPSLWVIFFCRESQRTNNWINEQMKQTLEDLQRCSPFPFRSRISKKRERKRKCWTNKNGQIISYFSCLFEQKKNLKWKSNNLKWRKNLWETVSCWRETMSFHASFGDRRWFGEIISSVLFTDTNAYVCGWKVGRTIDFFEKMI